MEDTRAIERARERKSPYEGLHHGNASLRHHVFVLLPLPTQFIFHSPSSVALVAALKKLGYTPYDFVDRIILGHLPLWTDALRAKFLDQGKPWGRAEFDRVFKGFDVRLDRVQ